MKISFCIIVMDGMPFIKHQLELIYPYAHQIIICEGGDPTWEKMSGYRHSQDETIEIIKKFPDPKNKIQLIQKNWSDKNHMCHEYSKRVTGDIIWHIDVDEFMDPAHIPYLMSLFNKYPEYDAIAVPQVVFWGDTQTILNYRYDEAEDWSWKWYGVDRIYRRKKGEYIHHFPDPGYFNPVSGHFTDVTLFPDELFNDTEIFNYHFSYILPKSVRAKMKYYDERNPDFIKPGWFDNVFMRFEKCREKWIASQFDVQPVKSGNLLGFPCILKPLEIPIPDCLNGLERDLKRSMDIIN